MTAVRLIQSLRMFWIGLQVVHTTASKSSLLMMMVMAVVMVMAEDE